MARKKRKNTAPDAPDTEGNEFFDEEGSDFEALLDLDPDGLLVVESGTRKILWANRTAERLLKKKREKLLAEPFPEDLEDGPMRTMDLNRKLSEVNWAGEPAQYLTLQPIQAGSASFALEWRLEAAEERAREAEEQVEQLRVRLKEQKKAAVSPEREQELQGELSRSHERTEQLERELHQLEERADRAEQRAREAENLMEEAESQAQEAERSLEDLSDSVRQVEEQLDSVRQELAAEVALRSELERKAQARQGDADEAEALQQEVEVLVQRLAEQEDLALQVSSQVGELRQQLEAAQAEKASWKQRQEEFDELEVEHLRVLTELEQIRVERQDLQDASSTQQTARNAEMEANRDRAMRLQEDLELQQLECEELREHLEEARRLSQETEQQLASLREQLKDFEQVRSDLEDVQQHLTVVEAERDDLLVRLDDVEGHQQSTAEASDALSQQLQSQAEALEAQTAETARLQAELEQLHADSAAAQARVEERNTQNRLLQEQLDDLVEQVDQAGVWEMEAFELRSQRDGLTQELEEARTQVQQLQVQLSGSADEVQAQIQGLEEQIATLRRQLESAPDPEALEELRVEVESARKATDDQSELTQQRESELATAQSRVQELEAHVEELSFTLQECPSAGDWERAQAELLELRIEVDRVRSGHEADRQELAASRARVAELEAQEPVSSDPELEPLRAELAAQQQQVSLLLQQLAATPDDSSELRARVTELEAQLMAATIPVVADDTGRVAELELQVEQLQAQLAGQSEAPVATSSDGMPPLDNRETEQLAFEDSLTKLPNFHLLRRYLDYSLKQVDRYQRRCALIHVDLDRFQALNEALGSAAGDEVLCQVAERLQKVVRTSDVLCRRGEDDFLILLSEVAGDGDSPESISVVLKRIQEMLAAPIQTAQQPVLVSASIGVSQFPSDAENSDQMLANAAAAVRRAKELGRNQVQFFTEELQKRHDARTTLEVELRRGVEARQFHLLYQPIVHLPTGRVAGVESLLRWNHPSYGVLTPDYFLEVAEETGLLNPIGRQVITQAAQQLYDWARQGLDLFVTVNLSTRQFLQADLVDTIRRALETTGAPAHNFVVEVPESVQMLDIQRVQSILLALRQAGVRVALDRFGSGFSSLERLHSELITLLKVDRKFLFHAASNAAALKVTVAALGLARGLQLRPVAVGVENDTQLGICRQLECEYVQGNLVYVPTDAAQISELARAGKLLK